jgi:hypothetical protein
VAMIALWSSHPAAGAVTSKVACRGGRPS